MNLVTLTLARIEDDPERWPVKGLPPVMKSALDKLTEFDTFHACANDRVCDSRIGSEFSDDDIDGVATGVISWHPTVLISDGERVIGLCDACDPNPGELWQGDLLAGSATAERRV